MIKAPRDFARDLDMGDLILAHGDELRAIQQDVRALQQRVTEETIRGEIPIGQLLLLILVRGHPLEPSERRDHRQQQMQFGVFGYARLDEQGRDARIQARREPVDGHRPHKLLQLRGVVVAGGQRVPVSDEEKAFILVLQLDPVLQRAMIIAEVQLPGRAHAGEHPPVL